MLIGIIDVRGFDFSHPDFIDSSGRPRFVRIWDQVLPPVRRWAQRAEMFGYGAELTRERDAVRRFGGAGATRSAPTDLAPQSVQVPGAHATHVASIGGREQRRLSNGPDRRRAHRPDRARAPIDTRRSHDSTRLAHAVDWPLRERRWRAPVPAADSDRRQHFLGTNGHAHGRHLQRDLPVDRRGADDPLDDVACVAAGNAGQQAPQFAGDLGHLTGRNPRVRPNLPLAASTDHLKSGRSSATGSPTVSAENELAKCARSGDELEVRFAIAVRRLIGPVFGRGTHGVENRRLESEIARVDLQRALPPRPTGANRISPLLLSPAHGGTLVVGISRPAPDRPVRAASKCATAASTRGSSATTSSARPCRRSRRVAVSVASTWRSNADRSSVSSRSRVRAARDLRWQPGEDLAERMHVSSSPGTDAGFGRHAAGKSPHPWQRYQSCVRVFLPTSEQAGQR